MPLPSATSAGRSFRLRRSLPSLLSAIAMAVLAYAIDTHFPLPGNAWLSGPANPPPGLHWLRSSTLAATSIAAMVVLLVARITTLHRLEAVIVTILAALLSIGAAVLAST